MALEASFNFHEPWDLVAAGGILVVAGVVAGLTIGIMGIDQLELRVLEENGSARDKRKYRRVAALLHNHHLILVALLVVNTICQETLPLFLSRVFPEWATVVFAVTFVLLFGEILPQALCSGRYRIPIVSFCSPLILGLSWVLWPIAWPIAQLLDRLVGVEGDKYFGRADLKTVVRLHEKGARLEELARQHSVASNENDNVEKDGLLEDEVIVIEGALDLANKGVAEIMVPWDQVFALDAMAPITKELRRQIVKTGHSRIPVFSESRSNVIGVLLVKSLVADPIRSSSSSSSVKLFERSQTYSTNSTGGEFVVRDYLDWNHCPKFVRPTHKLYDLMNDLQTGRHLALVTYDPAWHQQRWETGAFADAPPEAKRILGIVTIEDIFEELIQEEIYDEFDRGAHSNDPASFGGTANISAIVRAMKLATDVSDSRASLSNSLDPRHSESSPLKLSGINYAPVRARSGPDPGDTVLTVLNKEA